MRIVIASGKGGTGKTTLAVNLAYLLAESRQVILADLDVEEPNAGLFIRGDQVLHEDRYKMIPQWKEDACTLCGICQGVCQFHAVIQLGTMIMVFPELCHSCHACSGLCPESALPMVPKKMGTLTHLRTGNLDFVEGRLDIGEEQAVPLIRQTKQYLDDHSPDGAIRLVDAPPGTTCPVIEATRDADFVILVTEPTPFGLHDLKLAVLTMREIRKSFGVVLNRYGTGNDDVLDYCREENIRVLARIPHDRKIAELYSAGKPVYQDVPEARRSLDEIVSWLDETWGKKAL
ncbi:MAG: ATP-binding protein [Bacteroidales bacterium]|nr:ATP-binding protein [Bacteroidales bacterium]